MKALNQTPKFQPFRSLRRFGVVIALSTAVLVGGCGGDGVTERPVSELVAELQGEDESAAIAAAGALGQKKDPTSVDALILAATTNDSALVRQVSTVSLKFFDDPKAIAVLIALMTEGEGDVVPAAQEGVEFAIGQGYQNFGKAMGAAKDVTPEAYEKAFVLIQEMLKSPEEYKVANAVKALGQTGDPRAVELLVQQLGTGTDLQKQIVVESLGNIDSPESIAALKEAVSNDSPAVAKAASGSLRKLGIVDFDLLKTELKQVGTRKDAIATLGSMKTPESLQLLVSELNDDSITGADRERVVKAIASRPEPKAATILTDFLVKNDAGKRSHKVVLEALGEMAQKSKDSAIPSAVIQAHRDNPESVPVLAVIDSLANMGDIAYEPAVALLSDENLGMRVLGAGVLGKIGNEEAIAPLKTALTNRFVAPQAAKALDSLDWKPEGDREQVLVWLADRDKKKLTNNWNTTKTVLLNEASSGDGEAVANALYGFVGIGDESVILDLKASLKSRGTKEIALAYLNCGHPELESAAAEWARNNGFQVVKSPTAEAAAEWGSF
ncbi:MAG: HEAT repeat domain-containing protein [Cyanobacteria bacterium P01_C01_bin.89]